MGALLVATQVVVSITSRCQVYEDLYLNHAGDAPLSSIQRQLEEGLVGLYRASLNLLALAGNLLDSGTAKRIIKAIVSPEKAKSGLAGLGEQEDKLLRDVHACEVDRSATADKRANEMLEMLQAPMTRVDAGVSKLLNHVNKKERIEMLEWISAVPFGQIHDTLSEDRTPGTGDWLINHESFNRWKEGDTSALFWLQGNPGSGKTYLTSKAVDTIQHRISHPPKNEGFAFFYCKRFDKPRRDEPLTILQSFVRQLSTTARNPESMRVELQEMCEEARERGSNFRLEQCKQQILASLDVYPKTTLVIDAMDECDQASRHELVDALKLFLKESKNPVRIFISSRPDRDLELELNSKPNVEIQAGDNQEDIKIYIDVELTRLLEGKSNIKPMKPEIIPILLERCQGMFQWVSLQVKRVGTSLTRGMVKTRLYDLPPDLDKAYDFIWREIEVQEEPARTLTKRALRWAMAADKHLTTTEILAAIRVGENGDLLSMDDIVDEQGLLTLCNNFLVIDSQSKEWRFPHLSVREFLEKKEDWSTPHAHYYAASSCLSFFIANYKDDGKKLDAQLEADLEIEKEIPEGVRYSDSKPAQSDAGFHTLHPFHIYMRQMWPQHLNGAKEVKPAELSSLLKKFLGSVDESTVQYQRWYEKARDDRGVYYPCPRHFISYDRLSALAPGDAALFAMLCFPLDSFLGDWWESESISRRGANNLLTIAAAHGSRATFERLLQMAVDEGADAKAQGGILEKALLAASQGGNAEAVKVLLGRVAELNASDEMRYVLGNALQRAASCGFLGTVQVLLDGGVDVNSPNAKEGNALRSAAMVGHAKVVALLLERGAHDKHEGGYLQSVLLAAKMSGSPKVFKLLVDGGIIKG